MCKFHFFFFSFSFKNQFDKDHYQGRGKENKSIKNAKGVIIIITIIKEVKNVDV